MRVFVKNDGLTHPVYGGNKVRKAERIVKLAANRQKQRILTFGTAGSHHVLTMGLFAREAGIRVAAVLMPQVATPHVEDTLRASIAAGVEVFPAHGPFGALLAALRAHNFGDVIVPPGASNVVGALACADAVAELVEDVRRGTLPEPDLIVVPVGSGGTCAGILAGVVHHGLKSRVVGVPVLENPLTRFMLLGLARRTLRRLDASAPARALAEHLVWDWRFVGPGYGRSAPASERALALARDELGLELDSTYTAKTFACVLDLVRNESPPSPRSILYWHTLSAAPLGPLLHDAPALADLPRRVTRLLLPSRDGRR